MEKPAKPSPSGSPATASLALLAREAVAEHFLLAHAIVKVVEDFAVV